MYHKKTIQWLLKKNNEMTEDNTDPNEVKLKRQKEEYTNIEVYL
jgi:hypothetical protein